MFTHVNDEIRDRKLGPVVAIAITATFVFLAIFLLAIAGNQIKKFFYGYSEQYPSSISVEGVGESTVIPNIASFDFSVSEEKPTAPEAQAAATEKINKAIAYLRSAGVEEKDIKTTNYSIYPVYNYIDYPCSDMGYCTNTQQEIRGYQVDQSVTVKVRDTAKVGDMLTEIAKVGASYVSSLMFITEDDEDLKTQAREAAIADAKVKAERLAEQLGVKLVRLTGYYETAPYPYYDSYGGYGMKEMSVAASPELPVGENTYESRVTLNYEIK